MAAGGVGSDRGAPSPRSETKVIVPQIFGGDGIGSDSDEGAERGNGDDLLLRNESDSLPPSSQLLGGRSSVEGTTQGEGGGGGGERGEDAGAGGLGSEIGVLRVCALKQGKDPADEHTQVLIRLSLTFCTFPQ